MIDNNQQPNPKLTLEQMQGLAEYQDRLSNLQNEAKIANQNLVALKNDTSRITKEKEYQGSLLDNVNTQILLAQNQLNVLDANIVESMKTRDGLNQEIASKTSVISAKEMSIKDREDCISNKELESDVRETGLDLREENVKTKEIELSDKYAKIKEFAKNI